MYCNLNHCFYSHIRKLQYSYAALKLPYRINSSKYIYDCKWMMCFSQQGIDTVVVTPVIGKVKSQICKTNAIPLECTT